MTSTPITRLERPQEQAAHPVHQTRWWVLLMVGLFVLVFRNFLERMLWIATNARGDGFVSRFRDAMANPWNPDWSHALVIPLISLYYIHLHRQHLQTADPDAPWKPLQWALTWAGPGLMLLGAALFIPGIELWGGRLVAVIQLIREPIVATGALIAALSPLARRHVWAPLLARVGVAVTEAGWARFVGLLIMLAGLTSYMFWIGPGRNDMFQGYSLIACLFGLMLLLAGPGRMHVLWFPVAFLVFAVKIADRIWDQIAWKLQLIASRSAGVFLNFVGIDAEVTGSTIVLYRGVEYLGRLNVAEACSGLRMLMAFVSLGVALAFLFDRRWWQRLIMVLMTVPIAVLVNVGRVTALGMLYLIDPELASGDFHTFVGLLMLIPAGLLFLALGWVLDQIIIYEDKPGKGGAGDHEAISSSEEASQAEGGATGGGHASTIAGTLKLPSVLAGVLGGATAALAVGVAGWMALARFRDDLRPDFLPAAAAMAVTVLVLLGLLAGAVAFVRFVQSLRWHRHGLPLGMAIGVFLVAALGLNVVLYGLGIVLLKGELPLQKQLYFVPTAVPGWEMIHEDPPLTADVLEVLGTRQYISRVYRDTTLDPTDPSGTLRLHVAYYTGKPDTVPHVPDRCFLAGGVHPLGTAGTVLRVGGPGYITREGQQATALSRLAAGPVRIPRTEIPATIFTFINQERGEQAQNVIYFFAANGKYLATPEDVRLQGFSLRDKYSYYCKIEVGVFGVPDPDEAARRAGSFLSAILPEIMACLPDWVEVTEGRWPPSGSDVQLTATEGR